MEVRLMEYNWAALCVCVCVYMCVHVCTCVYNSPVDTGEHPSLSLHSVRERREGGREGWEGERGGE